MLVLASAVVFVDTAFYAAIAPLLPYYAQRFDLAKPAAGVLAGAYPAGALLAALPSGLLVVRLGVRRTTLVGLVGLALSSAAFALAPGIVLLDLARFVQGVGGACSWAGVLAWLAQVAPPQRRGELIGTAFGAAIGGSLLGPVLGAAGRALGPGPVFGAVAGLAVLLAGATRATAGPPARLGSAAAGGLGGVLREPRVRLGAWLVALVGLLYGVLELLVPLRLDELGASGLAVGATFLVAAAVQAALSPLSGRYSDRHGRDGPIRFALAASAVGAGLLVLPQAAWLLAVLAVLVGNLFGILWVPALALLTDGTADARLPEGYAFGLTNLVWGLGTLAGAAGGGALAGAVGDAGPYAVLVAACAGSLAGVTRRQRPGGPAPRAR